jgi:hypothetical protein
MSGQADKPAMLQVRDAFVSVALHIRNALMTPHRRRDSDTQGPRIKRRNFPTNRHIPVTITSACV